ncbi:MAG: enoyl-CoA hydratase [Proteobacteria bacterium]|nr:enoyl-CoA hydratase [Pseudomonadota bacterium]
MSDLLESVEDGIAWLTLNRPERMNALSTEIRVGLSEALIRYSGDTSVGVVVLTGAGRGFCAGGDVKAMAEQGERTIEDRVEGFRVSHEVPRLLRTISKVVIAMVNGPVAGAGLGLALACDLRIAARSAHFSTGFGNVGYSGDWGGSWTLTRLVGTAKARELYFLGERVNAEAALSLGMVNWVVDDAALRAETTKIARRIADGPQVAYRYMKRNLHAAETESFDTVLDMEAIHQSRTGTTEDHAEAVRAFVEKRKPKFKGR